MQYNFVELEAKLQNYVDEKRFRHIKGVEMTAACMAMKFAFEAGMDEEALKAYVLRCRVAGLLHDNAKCNSDEKLLQLSEECGLPIREIERKSPFLLHGKLGAYYLSSRYHIEDEEIANAISYHTTGRPAMTMMEKIIFTADYIEPGRDRQRNLGLIRYLALTDLDTCVYKISQDTLDYLDTRSDEMMIDELTVATRDYYRERAHFDLLH